MKNVKIIRLTTGEDVIGDIDEYADHIVLKKSFVLIPRQMAPGQPIQLMLSPWQPYTDDGEVKVMIDKVITMINPKSDIKKNYEENTSGILQPSAQESKFITEAKLPKL